MKRFLYLILLFGIGLFPNELYSQDKPPLWMIKDYNRNFYEIQADFNKYWEGKVITKETPREERMGWKQFKRWEWFWEQRVAPSGVFPNPGHTYLEYSKYRELKSKQKDRKQAGDWTFLGPSSSSGGYWGLGRLNCVIEDPRYDGVTNKTIFVGGASGGVWKTTNGGQTWATTTDEFAALGIADIVINPLNPDIIYVATGDGDATDTYSFGVVKSTDGGNTWNLTGLQFQITNFNTCRRMVINPSNPNILLVATNNGLYRTTNAGTNWTSVQNGDFWDVKLNPADPNIVYAATTSQIYRSTNGGINWTSVSSISGSTRIALAVTPADSANVYALSSNGSGAYNGLYRSTNSGSSFSLVSSTPNILSSSATGTGTTGQGWYDLSIAIDPTNANIVYVGGVNIWKSTNGGANWSLRAYWTSSSSVETVHADHHMLYFGGTNRLYTANDGGLDVSTNGGVNWTYLSSGVCVTQYYRIATSQTNPSVVIGGAQDNSSSLMTASSFTMTMATGDGMDQAINPSNGNTMFTSSYYGDLYRSTNGGSSWTDISEPNDNGGWVTPYVIDPNNHTTLVAGYTGVWKSTNNGTNWTKISTFTNSTPLTVIHVAPANSNYIYAGYSSALWRTTDGGSTWSQITLPFTSLSSLTTNHSNPDVIWITMSGYSSGNKVFKSTNGGQTWQNISGNLPNVPCNVVIYQPNTDNRVWVGTDIGVWYRGDSDPSWVDYNDGLPNVICNDLEIQYSANKLRLGTYGRGLWEATLPGAPNAPPSLTSPLNNASNTNKNLSLQWSPSVNAVSYRVQVSTSSNFNNLIVNSLTANTSFNLTNLNYNTQYFWRVKAYKQNDSTDWSESWNFTTRIEIYPPTLVSPQNNANNYANLQTFFWNVAENATSYRLQISNDSLFNSLILNQVLSDTSYSWSNLPANSAFYWRVHAFNSNYTSGWSEIRKLTTYNLVTVQIGSGTATSQFPYYTYYHDAVTYLLYTSSEILSAGGFGGLIQSIGFNVTSVATQPMNGFSIYMQNTTLSSVTAPITSGWTLVHSSSSFAVAQTGWTEHVLSTPFAYDTTKNLLIKICFDNSSYTLSSSVQSTTISSRAYARYADNHTNTCSTDPSSATSPSRANIRITFTSPLQPPVLLAPAQSAVLAHDRPAFSWSAVNNAQSYQLQVLNANNAQMLNIFTNQTQYQSAPLYYEGQVTWRVRAISGTDTSGWNTSNFTITRSTVTHSIPLVSGWNMISSYAEPDNLAIPNIFSPLGNNLQIVRNVSGQTYIPNLSNMINEWQIRQAYQIRTLTGSTLNIQGLKIIPNSTPIVLNTIGWYWIPYFRIASMPVSTALSSINGKYLQVKSITGEVYYPPYITTLQNLEPGKGYMLRSTSTNGVLVYPANPAIKSISNNSIPEPVFFKRNKHITGKTSVIGIDIPGVVDGDEIGVFTEDGLLVGSSVWSDVCRGVVVWGDDEFTSEKDGAFENERLQIKIWKNSTNSVYNTNIKTINNLDKSINETTLSYKTDDILNVSGQLASAITEELLIYPQPSSGKITISVLGNLEKKCQVIVFDYKGTEIFNKYVESSNNRVELEFVNISSGIYQIIVIDSRNIYKDKFIIVK
ncbi:MAG: T9SS type A sorting domain-containing protein [Bacteroidota bacterium]